METLMKKARFPREAMDTLLPIISQLKERGQWETIESLAWEVMNDLSGEDILVTVLKKTEALEEEFGVHKYTLDLFMLLVCWGILEQRYEEKGLSHELFIDTLQDIRCKLVECHDVYGVYGIFVGSWYLGFFDMTRFTLGRLQYELKTYELEESYEGNGYCVKKGDKVINIHIPSDGNLNPEAAEASLQLAMEYYKDEFVGKPYVFVMDSWLLDKDLMALMPEGNIKKFVEHFTVLHGQKEEKFMDGWRVFYSEWEKDPSDLPRRTRLQKAIAEYLQNGGTLGEGYGIFLR